MLHRGANDFRLVKGFLADTLVDADNVLPHYSSGTNIQMSIIWSFNQLDELNKLSRHTRLQSYP
jgi:hypothetical protein